MRFEKVKNITFIFENTDYFSFDKQYIGAFIIDDITTSICHLGIDCIVKEQTAHKVMLELFSEGDEYYDEFGLGNKSDYTKFERLQQYSDIVAIEILYESGTTDYLLVDYDPNNEEADWTDNMLQETLLTKPGNLYIAIGEDCSISDFTHYESIQDPEMMKDIKELYGIKVGDVL